MELIFSLLFFAVPLVVCGMIIGRSVEKNHFAELDQKEAANRDFLVTNLKTFPMAASGVQDPNIVMSEVVIGSDYLKSWLAGWRGFFGGEIKSLQTLQVRAKREAIVRLIDQARQQGLTRSVTCVLTRPTSPALPSPKTACQWPSLLPQQPLTSLAQAIEEVRDRTHFGNIVAVTQPGRH